MEARHREQLEHLYESGLDAIAHDIAGFLRHVVAVLVPQLVYCDHMFDDWERSFGGLHPYEDIISLENILAAWKEFAAGKRRKPDVQAFQSQLMDNLLELHEELKAGTYRHGGYKAFKISDPKPRDIHKATVRDRLLHHAIYRVLYPLLDRTWISDSFSCRDGKGTHRAMDRYRTFFNKVSKNHTRTCWVLQCDVRKFFASIDHEILLDIFSRRIPDTRVQQLIRSVVVSFDSGAPGVGLPLGNLTSQMLVNLYMNEFDQYMKHRIRAQYYIRYADDFVILSESRAWLESILPEIRKFLGERLHLSLHPLKVHIQTAAAGVDFLGWIHFSDHRILRTTTKHRMFRNLAEESNDAKVESYLGLLSHGNAKKLAARVG